VPAELRTPVSKLPPLDFPGFPRGRAVGRGYGKPQQGSGGNENGTPRSGRLPSEFRSATFLLFVLFRAGNVPRSLSGRSRKTNEDQSPEISQIGSDINLGLRCRRISSEIETPAGFYGGYVADNPWVAPGPSRALLQAASPRKISGPLRWYSLRLRTIFTNAKGKSRASRLGVSRSMRICFALFDLVRQNGEDFKRSGRPRANFLKVSQVGHERMPEGPSLSPIHRPPLARRAETPAPLPCSKIIAELPGF